MADDKAQPHITLNIPQTLIIAAITALASGSATRCNGGDAATSTEVRTELREVRRSVADLAKVQTEMLNTLNANDQASRNRDAIQDATLAGLRNR